MGEEGRTDCRPRPQGVLPLNRNDTFLAPYKEMYSSLKNAFVKQKNVTPSTMDVFGHPDPASGRTAEGMYIEVDENEIFHRLLTPAGSVRLIMDGGWLHHQEKLSSKIKETMDWELKEVGTLATYTYFESDDKVRGPREKAGDRVYWIQRVGQHHTPAEIPVRPYYFASLVISEPSRTKDKRFFTDI